MSGKLPCLIRVEDGAAWRLEPGQRYGLGRDLCNHFVANSSSVAMRHLELWLEGGHVVVEDAGLAPRTVVDGEVLDGEVRRLRPGTCFETGSVAWRISAHERHAEPPAMFALESARRRLVEGAKQKKPYRRWTRGWKDLHGRPIAGLLGPQGGAFWFRVFAQELAWDDDPVAVYTALAEAEPATLTRAQAQTVMNRRYLTHAADAPIAFTLAEMFGPNAALDMVHAPNARVLSWLGAFPEADVQQVIDGLKDADEVMAVAMNANMPAAGLRRVRQLRPSQTWDVERWMLRTLLTPEELFALAREFEMRMSTKLVMHLIELGSDDLVIAIHEAVAEGRTFAGVSALCERPLPQFAAAMLRGHVREIRTDSPHTPVPPDVVQFCENGKDVATAVLVDAFDEMPGAVAETFAMMGDEHLTALWPDLPPALCDAIEERFGTPTGDLPELPRARWTPWMHHWAHKKPDSAWSTHHQGGPRMATRDGFRLPLAVERGLYWALDDTEFSMDRLYYDEHLLEVRRDIDPRTAMRSMWWQLSRQREPDRSWSRHIVQAGAAFILEDRDLIEVAHNTRDMMERELLVSEAPIVPMLLWLRGWGDFKRVPDAALPPRDWTEEVDPDDEMFDEWPEGALEEILGSPRTPPPNFWDVPPDLTRDDWSRFTDWAIERLPAHLPRNADDLARQWLRANAADRTLLDLERWRSLIGETWLAEIGDELIWVALIGEQRMVFRVDADDCVDVDGDVIELTAEALLHLAHPMDLDPRLRVDWAHHLAEHEIMSLFDQLDTTGLRDEPDLTSVFGREARSWAMDAWDRDYVDSRDDNYELWRDFGTRGRAVAEVRGNKTVGLRFFDARGDEVDLDRVDPVVRSQTVADFEYAFRPRAH